MLRSFLSLFRSTTLRRYRVKILSDVISDEIQKLPIYKKKKIKILDYGSGYNPILIDELIKKLRQKNKKKIIQAYCFDLYDKKQIKFMNTNANIKFSHANDLWNNKKTRFDFCLLIDTLHHVGELDSQKVLNLTKKLKKRSKIFIIKDHLQQGFFSNFILRCMDFIGNYEYKTSIPSKYFDNDIFNKFISKLNFVEIKRITNQNYYKWYWFYLNNKKFHFISILK